MFTAQNGLYPLNPRVQLTFPNLDAWVLKDLHGTPASVSIRYWGIKFSLHGTLDDNFSSSKAHSYHLHRV
jgi:hypothetical protein